MIAVAHHQAPQVPLGMLLVRRLAVDAVRRVVPLVEALVPHDIPIRSHSSSSSGAGGIVAGANRVDAHLPHDLELPLHRPRIERGAERALIVVQAHAVELHAPAVEMEAVVGGELERANAERLSCWSTTSPPTRTIVRSVYRLRLSMSHSCGLSTVNDLPNLLLAPARRASSIVALRRLRLPAGSSSTKLDATSLRASP